MNPFDKLLLEHYAREEYDRKGDHPRQDLTRYPSDGLVGLQYGREALLASNARQDVRPVVFGGTGSVFPISIAGVNVVKKASSAVVYASNYGPLTNNNPDPPAAPVVTTCDELWVKFASPVLIKYSENDVDVYGTSGRTTRIPMLLDMSPIICRVKNLYAPTGLAITVSATMTLQLEAATATWDPATLTYANKPKRFSTAGALIAWDSFSFITLASDTIGDQYQEEQFVVTSGQEEFKASWIGLPAAMKFWTIQAAPAPTASAFKLNTPTTGPWADNDFGVGGLIAVRAFIGTDIEWRTITAFDAATRVFTVDSPFTLPTTAGTSVQVNYPCYGFSLSLQSGPNSDGTNPHWQEAELAALTSISARYFTP